MHQIGVLNHLSEATTGLLCWAVVMGLLIRQFLGRFFCQKGRSAVRCSMGPLLCIWLRLIVTALARFEVCFSPPAKPSKLGRGSGVLV